MSYIGDLEAAILRRIEHVFTQAGLDAVKVLAMPNNPDAVTSAARITLLVGFVRARHTPTGALGALSQRRATEIALAWKFQSLRRQSDAYPYLEAVRAILNGWCATRPPGRRDGPAPGGPARTFTGPIAIASERLVDVRQGVWGYLQIATVPDDVAAAPERDALALVRRLTALNAAGADHSPQIDVEKDAR